MRAHCFFEKESHNSVQPIFYALKALRAAPVSVGVERGGLSINTKSPAGRLWLSVDDDRILY